MKKIYLLLIFTASLMATVYENAENESTKNWTITDNRPKGAKVINTYDDKNKSFVIVLAGKGRLHAYQIGAPSGNNAWLNQSELILKFNMYSHYFSYQIDVQIETDYGSRILRYTPSEKNLGQINDTIIHHTLSKKSNNGTWQHHQISLEDDLKDYEPNNKIISVNGMEIRGRLSLDNIELTSSPKLSISNVYVDNFSPSEVKINWDLSNVGTGQVEYGEKLKRDAMLTNENSFFSTKERSFKYKSHGQRIKNLLPNTTYEYRITSENKEGVSTQSKIFIFQTTGTKDGLKISKINTPLILEREVKINWTLSDFGKGQVEYSQFKLSNDPKKIGKIGQLSILENSFKYKEHTQKIKNLIPNTTYNYRIIAVSKNAERSYSSIRTFKTKGNNDLTFSNINVPFISGTEVHINWMLSDFGTGYIEYSREGGLTNFSIRERSFKYKEHTQKIKNLAPNTKYSYIIISTNKEGNEFKSKTQSFTTPSTREKELIKIAMKNCVNKIQNTNHVLCINNTAKIIVQESEKIAFIDERKHYSVSLEDQTVKLLSEYNLPGPNFPDNEISFFKTFKQTPIYIIKTFQREEDNSGIYDIFNENRKLLTIEWGDTLALDEKSIKVFKEKNRLTLEFITKDFADATAFKHTYDITSSNQFDLIEKLKIPFLR